MMLGDEAVALGALHAGIAAAYSYPGTPATEILEFVRRAGGAGVVAHWAANEKTAYEQALGVSLAGRRALVSMKHVGLNVAADAFVNSALVEIGGGLVLAVADDPGMHSSQNEQDSRYLADFARVPCLEPADQQQAYDFTREAFDLSERFQVPVVLRLVTRLAHGRAPVVPRAEQDAGAHAGHDPAGWVLLPGNARRLWRSLLEVQPALRIAASRYTVLTPGDRALGVITCGVAVGYYRQNLPDLPVAPAHLHVGGYPVAPALIRDFAGSVDRVLVLEDGYPYLERRIAGMLADGVEGRDTGRVPASGELDPDVVREALGLPPLPRIALDPIDLPGRPPRLCPGCPHMDSFAAVNQALEGTVDPVVTADIGCYTLGALPPYRAIDSCVCMGASIGMAKGASDAGMRPVLAVIGDGTFLHSGMPPMLDAVAADTDMTVLILDNRTIAMTGLQDTVVPDSRLEPILAGIGVDPAHLHVVETSPRTVEELAVLLRKEMGHAGLSVIVAVRECVEKVKHDRRRR